MLHTLPNRTPQIHPHTYIAENATVIGAVTLGESSSIWFNAVLRADNDAITIGTHTNIQDAAILHVDPQVPLTIGDHTTIGHGAILHGCTIGNHCLIGIGSRILNHAHLPDHCLVGANTLITENKTYPPRTLILGTPGKPIRPLTDPEIHQIQANAAHYAQKIPLYQNLQTLKREPES